MSDKSPAGSSSPSSGGVSRFVGVGLSLIIGLVTFTIGVSMFPVEPPRAPVAPPPPVPSAPPAPPAPAAAATDAGGDAAPAPADTGDDAGEREVDRGAPDGVAPGRKPRRGKRASDNNDASAASTAEVGAEVAPADAATTASADDADGTAPTAPAADCTLPEKDLAREAWRHNWPTICPIPDSGKAFIIFPVKGPIENAVVELKRKPVREARVTLPTAESLLTLKLYKLKRLGFKDLKIGPGDDGTGTRFRVRLMNGAGDPVFDVKDTYAKITVASPPE